jgi:hypothetical protein
VTALAKRKTKARLETSATVRGRALVVEAQPFMLSIRPKGKRIAYAVPWDAIYSLGAKLAAKGGER